MEVWSVEVGQLFCYYVLARWFLGLSSGFYYPADTLIKPARLAVVVTQPTLLATGTSLWRLLSQHSSDGVWASLIFSPHIARLYINNFLTVQAYMEVQKQTMSF